jgi:hypothetical protein
MWGMKPGNAPGWSNVKNCPSDSVDGSTAAPTLKYDHFSPEINAEPLRLSLHHPTR